MEIGFRDFLLNENRAYLGQKLGDILNALQDLNDNAKGMGTRQLVSNSEGIVNQMRRILHSRWNQREEGHLKDIQKVGVAIMKAIEEKDDLEAILQGATQEIEGLMGRLDVPANKLASDKGAESPQGEDGETSPPEQPPPEPAQAPQGAAQPGPQAPGPAGVPQPMPPAGAAPGPPGAAPMPPMPPAPM